jgi:hypothetical protein
VKSHIETPDWTFNARDDESQHQIEGPGYLSEPGTPVAETTRGTESSQTVSLEM